MHQSRLVLAVFAGLFISAAGGCFTIEGNDSAADENQASAGWQDRGRDPGSFSVDNFQPGDSGAATDGAVTPGLPDASGPWDYELSYTDVILSPDGAWLLAMAPAPGPDLGWDVPALVLVAQALPSGDRVSYPSVTNLARINFAPDGSAAYLLHQDHKTLSRLDFGTMAVEHLGTFDGVYTVLDVTTDGRFLIGSNLPTTDAEELFFQYTDCDSAWLTSAPAGASRCEMGVFDTTTGGTLRRTFALPLRDLDQGVNDGEVITTMSSWDAETGDPETTITFVDLAKGTTTTSIKVPNCADELKVQPGGHLGLLSPRWCNDLQDQHADPISVIDLQAREFITNLPGFGPVVISDDGERAVGFTRRADMLAEFDYVQEEEVGLIVVDLPALTWSVIEYGSEEPAYHLASDGVHLYTYEPDFWDCGDTEMRMVDLQTGEVTDMVGPDIGLIAFVEAREAEVLYAIHDDLLVSIAVGSNQVVPVPIAFEGGLINIAPEGDLLVLGRDDAPEFTLVPLADPTAATSLSLGL